jgi:hypothetical protein
MDSHYTLRSCICALASVCLIGTGCAKHDDEPAPQKKTQTPDTGQGDQGKKGDETGQSQTPQGGSGQTQKQAGNERGGLASPDDKGDIKRAPSVPIPSGSLPNKHTVATVLSPQDDVMLALTRLFVVENSDAIEQARDQVVDEIFYDEGEAQGRIVEVQSAVAKLANNNLYSPEAKNRVAYLQSGIRDRIISDQNWDILKKGTFFVVGGTAVGMMAGTHAWRYYPEVISSAKNGWNASTNFVKENTSKLLSKSKEGWQSVTSPIRDRARREELIDSASAMGSRVGSKISRAVRRPMRSAHDLVHENLEDLGLDPMDLGAIRQFRPVDSTQIPPEVEFLNTPKSTFKYAVLDRWEGEDLGLDRMLVFKQQSLLPRGAALDTDFVTERMPAEVAGRVANKLRLYDVEPESRQFVHFQRVGSTIATPFRWTAAQFRRMLAGTNDNIIQPMFRATDVPTAVGTGVATTALLSWAYHNGYGNGQNNAQQMDAIDLESLIRSNQPGGQILTSELPGATTVSEGAVSQGR